MKFIIAKLTRSTLFIHQRKNSFNCVLDSCSLFDERDFEALCVLWKPVSRLNQLDSMKGYEFQTLVQEAEIWVAREILKWKTFLIWNFWNLMRVEEQLFSLDKILRELKFVLSLNSSLNCETENFHCNIVRVSQFFPVAGPSRSSCFRKHSKMWIIIANQLRMTSETSKKDKSL